MLLLIAASAFLMIVLATTAIWQQLSARPARLDARVAAVASGAASAAAVPSGRGLLRAQGYSSSPLLQRLLAGRPSAARLAESLKRAGLEMRAGEFILISVGLAAGFALVVVLIAPAGVLRLLLVAAAIIAGLYLPRRFLKSMINRRRASFELALPDALDMISRSLRVGTGLLIAIEHVTEELKGVIAEELGLLQQQIGAGMSVEDAFRELDRRVTSADLHIAVTAILIEREVGGNLAEILDNITRMMRERVRLRGEMKALTARQVWSTNALALMPPVIFVLLMVLAPDLTHALIEQRAGWVVLGISATLEFFGFLIIRRMASSTVEV